ncbi:hypothetical protein AKO1_006526, partial [Acrasis kona]
MIRGTKSLGSHLDIIYTNVQQLLKASEMIREKIIVSSRHFIDVKENHIVLLPNKNHPNCNLLGVLFNNSSNLNNSFISYCTSSVASNVQNVNLVDEKQFSSGQYGGINTLIR